jgi:hypothetical protein
MVPEIGLMACRIRPGPVFWLEIKAAARRRRTFVARMALVTALLAIPGLGMYMNTQLPQDRADLGKAMRAFGWLTYVILATIQVTLVLIVAPACASDAVGRGRARGRLKHLLVTDLSALEIVLGSSLARLVPVLTLLLAALPVVMLEVAWFGSDPEAVPTLTAVSLGLAPLGVAVATAFSLRARRAFEALLGVYVLWALWLLWDGRGLGEAR